MASQIVLIVQTNFLFYPIKIRLEMAKVLSKVIKLASHGNSGRLAGGQMAGQTVPIELTVFFFYPIKIRLEMAEIQSKVTKVASHGNSGRLAGGQLDGLLDCTN